MFLPFIQGMGVGGGLIMAIGAQNAFVLSHGIRRSHPLTIAAICCAGDILLITIGVAGVGTLVTASPLLSQIATWGGALFLICYGTGAMRSALQGNSLETSEQTVKSLSHVIAATCAVTFLNPHAYLDTVVLVGSLSGQFQGDGRYAFGLGACLASFIWFFSLSFGAALLAPLFRKPQAWRILDGFVCLVMWGIAASLLYR